MEMGDLRYIGGTFTWANNRQGEGFIQEGLDRFCGSSDWLLKNDSADVKHIPRQASDHVMLLLDSMPVRVRTKARFI